MKTSSIIRPILRGGCRFSTSTVYKANVPAAGPEESVGMFEKERRKAEEESKLLENEAPWFLRAIASMSGTTKDMHKYNPTLWSMEKLRQWRKSNDYECDLMSQAYVPERHNMLGSDLASAQFIVFREGKVKFVGKGGWIEKDPSADECHNVPNFYDPSYYLEAIDMSNTDIRYEGLVNFIDLSKLKWLSFRNCKHVDDWFIDRLSTVLKPTMEHLDLSYCQGLTENMLSCLYRLPHLKRLVLEGIVNTPSFKLGCLELEDAISGLQVQGVNFSLSSEKPPKESHSLKDLQAFKS